MKSHWRMILIAENNQVRQVFLPIKTIKFNGDDDDDNFLENF